MSNRAMVTVAHPDLETTAVVPATALPQMSEQGWYEIPAESTESSDLTPAELRELEFGDQAEPPQTPAEKSAAKKPGQRATTTKEN